MSGENFGDSSIDLPASHISDPSGTSEDPSARDFFSTFSPGDFPTLLEWDTAEARDDLFDALQGNTAFMALRFSPPKTAQLKNGGEDVEEIFPKNKPPVEAETVQGVDSDKKIFVFRSSGNEDAIVHEGTLSYVSGGNEED